MTLEATMRNDLREWHPEPGRQTLSIEEDGWKVELTVDRADSLSCEIYELCLKKASAEGPIDLASWAKHLSENATGLMEPLRLLEIDAPRSTALLRSTEPLRRDEDLFYYEVSLQGTGEAAVRRYQASPQGSYQRKQIGFVLTHEAIAKLAEDLTGAHS